MESLQYTLSFICTIESWENRLNSKAIGKTILMGLSKAFHSLSHDLIIAKYPNYGLKVL